MNAPTPGQEDEQAKLAELVRAAKTYDHDNRPRGNWGSVPDHQVARLILGALGAMEPHAAPEVAAAPRELREAMAESRTLRDLLNDFTHAVIDLDARDGKLAAAARGVRKKAGLPS